jgi:GAF domain-containing protein
MYDPLVVDTFVRVYPDIAPESSAFPATLRGIGAGPTDTRRDADRKSIHIEGGKLTELESALRGHRTSLEIADIVSRHIRRLVPFSLSILYSYDVRTDELVAEHVTGEASHLVTNLRISRGERLSGWVAANRQTILNSDPMLDLGEVSAQTTPPLRNAVSVPLVAENELLGVLALYSATEGFTDAHRQIVETAAQLAANSLSNLRESIVVRA